jgi:hypothetical protein
MQRSQRIKSEILPSGQLFAEHNFIRKVLIMAYNRNK